MPTASRARAAASRRRRPAARRAGRRCGRSPSRSSTRRRRPARGTGRSWRFSAGLFQTCWPEDADLPLARAELAGGQLQQRGLARPVGARAGRSRPAGCQGQLVQADDVAVPLRDAAELDDRRHFRRSSDFTRKSESIATTPARTARTARPTSPTGTATPSVREQGHSAAALVGHAPPARSQRARLVSTGARDHPGGVRVQQQVAQPVEVGGCSEHSGRQSPRSRAPDVSASSAQDGERPLLNQLRRWRRLLDGPPALRADGGWRQGGPPADSTPARRLDRTAAYARDQSRCTVSLTPVEDRPDGALTTQSRPDQADVAASSATATTGPASSVPGRQRDDQP